MAAAAAAQRLGRLTHAPHSGGCLSAASQLIHDAGAAFFRHAGDAGATALLPFLQSQRHLRKFRLTPRLSRPVMAAVSEAVRANLPKKKATGLKKKKAAKK